MKVKPGKVKENITNVFKKAGIEENAIPDSLINLKPISANWGDLDMSRKYNLCTTLAQQKKAIGKDPSAVLYFKKPLSKALEIAVKANPDLILEIKDPSIKLQKIAIDKEWFVFGKMVLNNGEENIDPAIIEYAIECCTSNIMHIENPTEELQLKAIADGDGISCINNPTEKVQLLAIKGDPEEFFMIENPTAKVKKFAVKSLPSNIAYLDKPSKELQILAVKGNCDVLPSILNPCVEAIKIAFKKDPTLIFSFSKPSDIMMVIALKNDPSVGEQFKREWFV